MSDDHPKSTVFSDSTFSIEDDDECVIDDDNVDDGYIGGSATDIDIDIDLPVVKNYGDDNDDEHVHDQLPSVDEIKSSQAYIPTALIIAKSSRKKQIYVAIGIGIAAVIIGIIAIISVAASSIDNNKNNDVLSTFHDGHVDSRLQDVIDYLFRNKISPLPSLITKGTPDHYAAAFIADADNYQSAMIPSNEQRFIERYVLALLFYGTNGDDWDNKYSFLSAKDHCEWTETITTPAGSFVKGVECNEPGGYVTGIDLSHNNLIGRKIPKAINHLIHLERLHLHHNELGGSIPDLQLLIKLKSIGLMETGITGSIPAWLGDMGQLTTLALSKNDFYSTIPDSFKKLVNMRVLGLDGMGLKGDINVLKGMNALQALYLEDNHLTGELQGNVWTNIQELDLSNNMLDGTIPKSLLRYPNLNVLDLNRNLFYGDFPDDIVINDSIEYLAVHRNSLKGQLSDRIGYLTNLKHLDVGSNLLTGTIPDTIQQLTNLVSLSTSVNNFTRAVLYDYFSSMSKLEDLSMKANNFIGRLPNFFGGMSSLQLLDLDANDLSGTIPTEFGLMTNLRALLLNRNELNGAIPSVLSNLVKLKVLLLDSNNLVGKTNEICLSSLGFGLDHFIADCYPGKDDSLPEVECRCCTLCCNDADLDCNNNDWTVDNDSKAMYGSIRGDYNFGLDEAPDGWAKKVKEEAAAPQPAAPAPASTTTTTVP